MLGHVLYKSIHNILILDTMEMAVLAETPYIDNPIKVVVEGNSKQLWIRFHGATYIPVNREGEGTCSGS